MYNSGPASMAGTFPPGNGHVSGHSISALRDEEIAVANACSLALDELLLDSLLIVTPISDSSSEE
jgi:hypothetical protein